jgi:hypothetical protein
MLVATLGVRNASISWPVGRSNVLMTESRDVVTSHLESGENVCVLGFWELVDSFSVASNKSPLAYRVEYATSESTQFTHDSARLGVHDANNKVVASDRQ